MMDWDAIIPKLLLILKDRTTEIRRDISPERILESARADILASGVDATGLEFGDFPEGIQMQMLETLLHGINDEHRKMIRSFLEGLGEVVEDMVLDGDSFSGEDDAHVFVSFERMRLKLKKDLVLKIVSLGYAPVG